MPLPFFVYGTLRDPDVIAGVLGRRLPSWSTRPARAPGLRAVYYPGAVYPGIVAAPYGAAHGLIVFGLTPREAQILDRFEGTQYRRGRVRVTAGGGQRTALVYWPTIPIDPNSRPWQFRVWHTRDKAKYLTRSVSRARASRGAQPTNPG